MVEVFGPRLPGLARCSSTAGASTEGVEEITGAGAVWRADGANKALTSATPRKT